MNYQVKPLLMGLLYGVYEEVEVWISDCSWVELRLRSIHLNKENANNSLK